ncbi:sulfur carrier protein ThiS [Microbacteriaceae bacterium 4G12]
MIIQINGKQMEIPNDVTTVEGLLHHLQLETKIVVVEKNNVILEKKAHQDTTVFEGDQIEIVTFVGGG